VPTADDRSPPAPDQAPRTVVVTSTADSGLTTNVLVGDHHSLVADEPASVPNGHDAGPTPYGLLLASLGSCMAMTLRLYADRKEWPLEAVRVELSHGRIHARDCADCVSGEGMIDRIEAKLEIEGPLDEAQRARLHEIAGRCPVHRTLTSETRIGIELIEGAG